MPRMRQVQEDIRSRMGPTSGNLKGHPPQSFPRRHRRNREPPPTQVRSCHPAEGCLNSGTSFRRARRSRIRLRAFPRFFRTLTRFMRVEEDSSQSIYYASAQRSMASRTRPHPGWIGRKCLFIYSFVHLKWNTKRCVIEKHTFVSFVRF
jgi:hypothetical protein